VIVPRDEDDAGANLLSGVNKLALFRLFRIVPQVWNKVFRLQVVVLQGFIIIIILNVPLFQ